jgi:sigma-B regulation protein RsbU (phosphoserine phosphatase)
MVTSLSEGEYAKEAFDVGAMDFIAKPINEIELITRIKAAFRIKHKYDAVKQREARLIKELELAKTIQQKVLTPPIDDENIKVDAIYRPSEELAGDMYAWFRIDDYRYGFILFDVSGQGISASLVGMSVRSLLRGVITKVVEPIGVIKELNKHVHTLFHEEDSRYYLTALYVVVDTEHKQIRYVNAGHPTGLLFSGNDSEIIELNKGPLPVGLFSTIQHVEEIISYKDTARILMFTDGLIGMSHRSLKAGIDRLKLYLLDGHRIENKEFIETILKDLLKKKSLSDDICLISITVK